MKTILFTTQYPSNPICGGIERVVDSLTKSFLERGYRVLHLYARYPASYQGYEFCVPQFQLPSSDLYSEENRLFYQQLLREERVDIVMNQSHFQELELFLNTGNDNVVTITTVHMSPYYEVRENQEPLTESFLARMSFKFSHWNRVRRGHYEKLRKIISTRISYMAQHSTRLVFLSPHFVQEVRPNMNKGLHDKLVAIGNPNTYVAQPLHLAQKKNQLLYVGRMNMSVKRPDRILAAWKKLQANFPDWELVMLGDGPDLDYLKAMAKEFPRVRFEPFQDPQSFYQEASVLCLSSTTEGFGMVLTEAQVFGVVPVVFNSFASVTDIIADQQTGVLVRPFSITGYANALADLMRNQAKRERLARQGAESVKKFGLDQITDSWEALFDSL